MVEAFVRSWRDILRSACENPQKKREIADQVGFVSLRTIDRWISGQSNPQKNETIRQLSQVITDEEMMEALKREFPEAFHLPKQPVVSIEQVHLPSEFYRRVAHAYAHVPLASRRWTIFHLVSNQMLPHLDAECAGLIMIYVRCTTSTPPTLHFEEGAGNTIWTTRQMTQRMATANTGTQPWLGQAIAAGRPFFLQSCVLSEVLPSACFLHGELIQSIGFFPLQRGGMAAGGLLLCSTQEDFFTPLRQALIEEYSYLFSLALNDSDFTQTAP